jgi:hypothetical protein
MQILTAKVLKTLDMGTDLIWECFNANQHQHSIAIECLESAIKSMMFVQQTEIRRSKWQRQRQQWRWRWWQWQQQQQQWQQQQ